LNNHLFIYLTRLLFNELNAKDFNDIALLNKWSQRYGASLAIWDHIGLPSTQHKWTHPD